MPRIARPTAPLLDLEAERLVVVLALVIGLLARVFDYDYEDDDEDDMKIAPSGKEIQDGLAQAVASDVEGALLDFVA
jgi:hypothetical protein